MDCELEKSREKLGLDTQRFSCQGPCNRKELKFTDFEPRHILGLKKHGWRAGFLCKQCLYPVCDECRKPSVEAVAFGPAALNQMIRSMGKERWQRPYHRSFVCESCKYPPCCGCGANATRSRKIQRRQGQLWFCQSCMKKTHSSKVKWPDCDQCKRPRPQRPDNHAFRTWKCPVCWRDKWFLACTVFFIPNTWFFIPQTSQTYKTKKDLDTCDTHVNIRIHAWQYVLRLQQTIRVDAFDWVFDTYRRIDCIPFCCWALLEALACTLERLETR